MMKTVFVIVAVLFIISTIDAAPRSKSNPKPISKRNPKSGANAKAAPNPRAAIRANPKLNGKTKRQFLELFTGGSVYPNYFVNHPSPVSDFQNSFLQAAFLPGSHFGAFNSLLKQQNLTDSNGKPLPPDAKVSAAFEAAFGDKKGANITAKIFAYDNLGNINIVNPFLAAKDADGKLLKADSGLPGVKAGKLGEANGKAVSLVNPFHGSPLDPVFGPEIAPRYEIHYTPQGFNLPQVAQPFPAAAALSAPPPLSFAGLNSGLNAGLNADLNAAPLGAFDFSFQPGFNPAFAPAPFPFPFLPLGFDARNLKHGSFNGTTISTSTEQSAEGSTESFHEATSESNSESSNSESSSEPSSDSSSSEAPQ